MPGPRLCGRPACAYPATASLTFRYAARTLWLDDLGPEDPHAIDLCQLHADRSKPPQGWSGVDRRAGQARAGEPAADEPELSRRFAS